MREEVEAALREAGRRGLLRDGELYPKAVLMGALRDVGLGSESAARAFAEVRGAAGCGPAAGALVVEASGERRGRRYRFRGLSLPAAGVPQRPAAVGEPVQPAASPASAQVTEAPASALDIHFGDNLPLLRALPGASFDLIYIDPPFNTGRAQARTRVRTVRDEDGGDRTGFQGRRYRTVKVGSASFADDFDDFLAFLEPRLAEVPRLLTPEGSFFLHLDYREVHYCKVLLDHLFGRASFKNEIIWAYDYGARSRRAWSAKHDTILWYAKDPERYTFNFDEMDRIPYMAPGLVGKEKAARGKTPTDVWWHTIVPTNGRERTGYPTQKPLGVLNRILKVHTRPGDRVLDFFAGSGTTGEAAIRMGRSCVLMDESVAAMEVMARRLDFAGPRFHGWSLEAVAAEPPSPPAAPGEPAPGEPVGEPPQQKLFE